MHVQERNRPALFGNRSVGVPPHQAVCVLERASIRKLPTPTPNPVPTPTPPPSSKPAVIAPLSSSRFKIQFTASAALRDKFERLEALIPGSDLASVIDAAVSEKLERLEAKRFGKTNHPSANIRETSAPVVSIDGQPT